VSSFDGRSAQIGLLVTLLFVMLAMIGAVVVMAKRVQAYRKEAQYNSLSTSSSHGGDMELVESVSF